MPASVFLKYIVSVFKLDIPSTNVIILMSWLLIENTTIITLNTRYSMVEQ